MSKVEEAHDPTKLAIDIWKYAKAKGTTSVTWDWPREVPLVKEPTAGPLKRIVPIRTQQLATDMRTHCQAKDGRFTVQYAASVQSWTHWPQIKASLEPFEGDAITFNLMTRAYVYSKQGTKIIPGPYRIPTNGRLFAYVHLIVIARFPTEEQRLAWEICL